MARNVGQIVRRGPRIWLVRVYNGRDPETKKRKYLNQTLYGGLRDAQAHLNKMLGERDRGRNLDSSKQTLNQFLDRWLETRTFVKAIAGHEYECLLALAMTTGMRPSKYLALTSNNIDLDRGTVSVSRSLEWRKGRLAVRRYEAAAKPPSREAPGLVVSAPYFVQRYFKPLLKTAGLPEIRLYDLRHTAATISLVSAEIGCLPTPALTMPCRLRQRAIAPQNGTTRPTQPLVKIIVRTRHPNKSSSR